MGAVLTDELVERCAEAVFLDGVRALRLRVGGRVIFAWPKPDHTGDRGPKLCVRST